jgi:hypothetical protein
MPAWQYRLAEDELWAVVAFMQRLPSFTAADFERQADPQLPGRCTGPADAPQAPLPADADRGRRARTQHAARRPPCRQRQAGRRCRTAPTRGRGARLQQGGAGRHRLARIDWRVSP